MKRYVGSVLVCCVFVVWATAALAQTVDDLVFMTEQFPPYSFEHEGTLQGITVDVMVLMLSRLNSQVTRDDIRLLPWANAYNKIVEKPNTVLFSMGRIAARENLFKWVGPVITDRIGLLARKDAGITVNTLEDAKQYKIGVIRDDIGETLLLEAGIDLSALERVAKAEILVKLLAAGRIDLWCYDENVARWVMKNQGIPPEDVEMVFILREGSGFYAFHKETPDTLIQQFQQALDELKMVPADGGKSEYEKVLDTYLK